MNSHKKRESTRSANKNRKSLSTGKENLGLGTSHSQSDTLPDDIEDLLMKISLKRPKSGYNFFVQELYNLEKDKGGNITDFIKSYSKQWRALGIMDKEAYDKMAEKDIIRYQEHLKLARKYILSKPHKENVTAYRIYLDEQISEGLENNKDLKEVKSEARANWNELADSRRQWYEDQKGKVLDLYHELKDAKKALNGYNIFLRDKMAKARAKNKALNFEEVGEIWKNTSEATKDRYQAYAESVKEERAKQRDIYDIVFGLKPRRPLGAYKFFMMEKAKEGAFEGKNPMSEAAKLWGKLNLDEKEKYLRLAKKEQLAYMLKKMEFNAKKNKHDLRPLSAFNLFVSDMQGKVENPEEGMFRYCYNKWIKADPATKKKYAKMAEEEKVKAEERKQLFKERIYEHPRRPIMAYNRYIQDRIPELKRNHPDAGVNELFPIIGEEWKKMTEDEKKSYYRSYEVEHKKYKEQLEFFNENGYYFQKDLSELEKSPVKRRTSVNRSAVKSTNKKGKFKITE